MTWAVGACRTGLEVPLASRLTQGGFDAWTPSRRLQTPLRGVEEKAAFPGYLFLPTKQPDGESLMGLKAVAWKRWGASLSILMSGGEFGQVSDELVVSLKATESEGGFDEVYHVRNGVFAIGQRIRIIASGFAGLEGIVTRCKRHHTWLTNPEFPSADIRFPNSILQALEKTV